jgi:hypothetical protein
MELSDLAWTCHAVGLTHCCPHPHWQGGGLSRILQVKREIRKEVSRMQRGRESAPVVILAASVLYEQIMKHVRSGTPLRRTAAA